MKPPFSKEELSSLTLLLTYAATIIGAGQFTIQYFDPNLNNMQRGAAAFYGVLLVLVFCVANWVLLRKKK